MGNRLLSEVVIAVLVLFGTAQHAVADAMDDCRIEIQKGLNGDEAYVKNTNTRKKVKVTVSSTESTNGQSRKLLDKVYNLAAGERVFCGGTKFNNSTYTYTVAGASYE